MISKLTDTERQTALIIAGTIMLVGLVMAAAGRADDGYMLATLNRKGDICQCWPRAISIGMADLLKLDALNIGYDRIPGLFW